MKTFILGLLMAISFVSQAQAQQLELPLQHPDEILAAAHYHGKNLTIASYSSLPAKIQKALDEVDFALEAGDGYYDLKAYVVYAVLDTNKNVVGYMPVALLSYTEDPMYVVVAAYITLQGRRLNQEIWMDSLDQGDSEAIEQLPPELRPEYED